MGYTRVDMPVQDIEDSETLRSALPVIKLLADEVRWKLIRELRHSDRQVGELVERTALPQSLISYHLGILRQSGLIHAHRSDVDARVVYYWLDLGALQESYRQVSVELRLPQAILPEPSRHATIIFICNHNSARSQIAEGWMRHLSNGRITIRSAGVHPDTLNPLAIRVMAEIGIDIGHQYAKSLDTIHDLTPDIVVTVCDRAREECATGVTAPVCLHWSIPDPIQGRATAEERIQRFRTVRNQLQVRVEGLLASLPELIPALS